MAGLSCSQAGCVGPSLQRREGQGSSKPGHQSTRAPFSGRLLLTSLGWQLVPQTRNIHVGKKRGQHRDVLLQIIEKDYKVKQWSESETRQTPQPRQTWLTGQRGPRQTGTEAVPSATMLRDGGSGGRWQIPLYILDNVLFTSIWSKLRGVFVTGGEVPLTAISTKPQGSPRLMWGCRTPHRGQGSGPRGQT